MTFEVAPPQSQTKRKGNQLTDGRLKDVSLTNIFHALSFIIILWTNIEWVKINENDVLT